MVAPADVTTDAELPEIETPAADTSWAGDDPDTRQARAESISAASVATPINPDADPFSGAASFKPATSDPASEPEGPSDETPEGSSSDR